MSTEIKCECLDILCHVLHKYGNLMDTPHDSLLTSLLPQLSSNQPSVRKKSISCIADRGRQGNQVKADSANEYTDDDDVSWKVRRAAAKCLAALVVTQPEMLSKLYKQACSKLIDRFKERKSKLSPNVLDTFIYAVTSHANCYTQGLRECVFGK
ncbi:cullin-associated NEDD8-dissociated protein 1-like [Solanum tuberosum]|uniref:cullin-associated NEDD8-dissociated protein 1-like n=1 Tax=Solanum tuberosum TaxID=4113 RepID=UPI00073A2B8F|nr:PREDICTED: cullin-associated NEDD8-dissociated protein 1-like [Solanum tuberosum]XP_015163754.1 PREDICTED: cullin-associated NEDD8-dissociated protein 1-like [Solanum tuberosum]